MKTPPLSEFLTLRSLLALIIIISIGSISYSFGRAEVSCMPLFGELRPIPDEPVVTYAHGSLRRRVATMPRPI